MPRSNHETKRKGQKKRVGFEHEAIEKQMAYRNNLDTGIPNDLHNAVVARPPDASVPRLRHPLLVRDLKCKFHL
jgi:hypothetical protein